MKVPPADPRIAAVEIIRYESIGPLECMIHRISSWQKEHDAIREIESVRLVRSEPERRKRDGAKDEKEEGTSVFIHVI